METRLNNQTRVIEVRKLKPYREMITELGKLIKSKRQELNMSQYCLAVEIGLTNSQMISNIECGRMCLPIKRVGQMAKALQIEKEMLLKRIVAITEAKILGSETRD